MTDPWLHIGQSHTIGRYICIVTRTELPLRRWRWTVTRHPGVLVACGHTWSRAAGMAMAKGAIARHDRRVPR